MRVHSNFEVRCWLCSRDRRGNAVPGISIRPKEEITCFDVFRRRSEAIVLGVISTVDSVVWKGGTEGCVMP